MLREKYQAEMALSIFWILYTRPSPPAHELSHVHWCMTVAGKRTGSHCSPSFLPSLLRPQDPNRGAIANTPLHWKYGRHMVRQELQELREKRHLADALVPVAVGQRALWPRGTWKGRNGKHLKGRTCLVFFLGKGFSLEWLKWFLSQRNDGISWYKLLTTEKFIKKMLLGKWLLSLSTNLSTLYIFAHLFLIITLWDRY